MLWRSLHRGVYRSQSEQYYNIVGAYSESPLSYLEVPREPAARYDSMWSPGKGRPSYYEFIVEFTEELTRRTAALSSGGDLIVGRTT